MVSLQSGDFISEAVAVKRTNPSTVKAAGFENEAPVC
jgi:hypothetical protein